MDRRIAHVHARQIFDSRGRPTVEVEVSTRGGCHGRASVPSGSSTGKYEACELRDDQDERYSGLGVFNAVRNVTETIAPQIIDLDVFDQRGIDNTLIDLDGTRDKSRLGSNALLGVSLAVSRAACEHSQLPLYKYLGGLNSYSLPTPFINVINGGCHADNSLDFQEFMIVPTTQGTSFHQAIRHSAEVFYTLEKILKRDGLSTNVGDEGGFAPEIKNMEAVFRYLTEAVEKSGYQLGEDFGFALDVAASELFRDGKYHLPGESLVLSPEDMVNYLDQLAEKYPLVSIEDGLAQDDFSGFARLVTMAKKHNHLQIVGDDLIVTDVMRLKKAISQQSVTTVLIKPNQIGTLTETLQCIHQAHRHGLKTMISHRSGETEDPYIADLAVAVRSGQIKTGSLSRGERTLKYNQLLRIEEELSLQGCFGL